MENKIWTAAKACPDSSYNGEWYFYEDVGQLAPKWLAAEEAETPEEGTPQAIVILQPRKSKAFNDMYTDMKKCLEQVYTLNQEIQDFQWSPLEDLSWTSKDKEGNEQTVIMKDVLPSKEALPALLTQSDFCNALAVKLWLENPYQKPTDQTGKRINTAAWYALDQQLDWEIGKAKKQADSIKSDTSRKLADIDRELATSVIAYQSYAIEFQSKRDNYSTLLDEIVTNLGKSRTLARQIRYQEINPFNLAGP